MSIARLHRRLCVLMGLAALVSFAGTAGVQPVSTALAGTALLLALVWQPGEGVGEALEKVWLPLALLLVARAGVQIVLFGGDVVVPVVDLLLLLLCAEALRPVEALNDARLYALSIALLLASTAYRPGILFAVAFVAYVVLATVALVVGHLRRQTARHGVAPPRLRARFLLATAALSTAVLVSSVVVFLVFPRVSRAGPGRGDAPTATVAGFADQVSLGAHGSRILSNPRVVLRVGFPEGRPARTAGLRWRGRSYDHFDGVRWTRSSGIRPSSAPERWYRSWGDSLVNQRIWSARLDARVLFALHPIVDVDPLSEIQPLFDNVGDYVYWGRDTPEYRVTSVGSSPPPDSLRRARGQHMPDPARYLQLPSLPARIPALADSLTRGHPTRYDRVRAVERWLRTEFGYTRDLPATARQATLEHFLFDRRAGHCEYFSTAMVVLLRTQGIHARNVNGFLGGRWSDLGEYLAVTQNDAHSWVEVWFPGYGWVEFDPTPSGSGEGEATTSWLLPLRFALDAVQHRWGRWVLDYSGRSQLSLLDRLLERDPASAGGGGDETGLSWDPALVGLLVALAVGGGLLVAIRRGEPALRPETRVYRRLVRAARRSGWAPSPPVTPHRLVASLEAGGHPATAPARSVVTRYLRIRFGGAELGETDREELEKGLRAARRALKKTPAPPSTPSPPGEAP